MPNYPTFPGHWEEGQNARLAVKLTGWKIDIKAVSEMEVAADEDVFYDEPSDGNIAPVESGEILEDL